MTRRGKRKEERGEGNWHYRGPAIRKKKRCSRKKRRYMPCVGRKE